MCYYTYILCEICVVLVNFIASVYFSSSISCKFYGFWNCIKKSRINKNVKSNVTVDHFFEYFGNIEIIFEP